MTDPDILDEWRQYESLRNIDQITHNEAVINRLSRMLRPRLIENIVGAPRTTVPFDDVLNGDTMLIVSLPSERLGQKRCNFLGALLLCAFTDRIFLRRTTDDNPRVHLYLDEYQRFATITTAELLEEGRKYEAGVTMAHQSLFQIKDDRIRNASRHAGTLMVLPVTDPDAQLLVGEFPIKVTPEWTELIEEQDGFEPDRIPTPQPVTDILRKGHSDPAVHEAAAMLFSTSLGTHQDVLPHPAFEPGSNRDERFLLPSDSRLFVDLLRQVMQEGAPSRRELLEHLWRYNFPQSLEEASLLHIGEACTEWVEAIMHGTEQASFPIRHSRRGPQFPPNPSYSASETYRYFDARDPHLLGFWTSGDKQDFRYGAYHNTQLLRRQGLDIASLVTQMREWFDIQALCLDDPLNGQLPAPARQADERLMEYAVAHRWTGDETMLLWHGQDARDAQPEKEQESLQEVRGGIRQTIERMREELAYWYRWLSTLCEGLAEQPIPWQTANERPRVRTRSVLHSKQQAQDAKTEFSFRLITHPAPFMAHIKQARGDHYFTKLVDQASGIVNDKLVEEVRQRSQQLYAWQPAPAPPQPARQEEPKPRPQRPQPPITRRPPAQERAVGEDDESEESG